MAHKGLTYLSLVLCHAALLGFAPRACATVLPPVADGCRSGSPLVVPYLSELCGASGSSLSGLTSGWSLPEDEPDARLSAPADVEPAQQERGPTATEGRGGLPGRVLALLGAFAGSGMAPPSGGSSARPSSPDRALFGQETTRPPEAARLPHKHERIVPWFCHSRVFRPPRVECAC
jgi:hypothetical protein